MTGSDDLDVIDPAPLAVTYLGERLEIRPLTVGAVPGIVRLARPVIDAVLQLQDVPDENSEAMVDLALDMIDKHGEALFGAVALAIGREADWVRQGELDEFISLCKRLVEVNRDFFEKRLAPLFGRQAAALQSGAGPTPSSSSSSAATH